MWFWVFFICVGFKKKRMTSCVVEDTKWEWSRPGEFLFLWRSMIIKHSRVLLFLGKKKLNLWSFDERMWGNLQCKLLTNCTIFLLNLCANISVKNQFIILRTIKKGFFWIELKMRKKKLRPSLISIIWS